MTRPMLLCLVGLGLFVCLKRLDKLAWGDSTPKLEPAHVPVRARVKNGLMFVQRSNCLQAASTLNLERPRYLFIHMKNSFLPSV